MKNPFAELHIRESSIFIRSVSKPSINIKKLCTFGRGVYDVELNELLGKAWKASSDDASITPTGSLFHS